MVWKSNNSYKQHELLPTLSTAHVCRWLLLQNTVVVFKRPTPSYMLTDKVKFLMKIKRVCSLGWESPEILCRLEPGPNHKIRCCEWRLNENLLLNYKAPDPRFHFARLAMETNTCSHHPLPLPFSIVLSPSPSLPHRSNLLHAMMLHATQGNNLRGDNAVLSLGLVKCNKE